MIIEAKRMKSLAKRILPARSYRLLSKVYHRLHWKSNQTRFQTIEQILYAYSNYKKRVKFIQIGSNDGVTGDPLYRFVKTNEWKGIMVEPVEYIFRKLKKNYSEFSDNLIFENIAISNHGEKTKFYRLGENSKSDLPGWYEGLGSFSKETVLKHEYAIPNIRKLLIEEDIETTTLSDLLAKHSYFDVNLIHIDTEGYDFEIIKLIALSKLDLDIIVFEHKHLCDSDRRKVQDVLMELDFNLYPFENDTVAVSKKIVKSLAKEHRCRLQQQANSKSLPC